jgi:hypothetical protein
MLRSNDASRVHEVIDSASRAACGDDVMRLFPRRPRTQSCGAYGTEISPHELQDPCRQRFQLSRLQSVSVEQRPGARSAAVPSGSSRTPTTR